MPARKEGHVGKWLVSGPPLLYLVVFFAVPTLIMVLASFRTPGEFGGLAPLVDEAGKLDLNAESYVRFFTETVYAAVFLKSIVYALVTTFLCLVIAYPLAYFLALKANPRTRLLLLILVIVPFWTSFLIRTYAWIFILGGKGIPALLASLGFEDIRLINTPFAVMVGIVYAYLPLMVFPIYVGLEKLDKRLLEASADLYATPVGSFLQVTLPLSAPGVVTGCMLVFILLMGEYLIPALLGGGKVFFVGNALVDLFLQSRNWPFGAACAVALVAIMLVTVTLYMRLTLKSGTMRDQSLI